MTTGRVPVPCRMDLLLVFLVLALVLYVALHYAGKGNATMATAAEVCWLLWAIVATLLLCGVHLAVN
jgi:hypothetical protein